MELHSGLNVIEDCFQCNGQLLLQAVVKKVATMEPSKFDGIIIFLLEMGLESNWTTFESKRIEICDLRKKLLGPCDIFEEMKSFVKTKSAEKTLIAVDSLHVLQFAIEEYKGESSTENNANELCRFLYSLMNIKDEKLTLLMLAHGQLFRCESVRQKLEYLSVAWHSLSVASKRETTVIRSEIKKESGKTAVKTQDFVVDPSDLSLKLKNFDKKSFVKQETDKIIPSQSMVLSSPQNPKISASLPEKLPKSIENSIENSMNVPFKMGTLSEAEQTAKAKVTLPYTQVKHISLQDDGEAGKVKIHGMKVLDQPGSGLVHYVPDEADDLDDSDPDEDLNI